MNSIYLKEFITLSNSLNYAKAAEDLFISQSALRAHMRILEGEMGVQLLAKYNNILELTPAGRLLLTRARNVTNLIDETIDECRTLEKNSTSLVVGMLDYAPFEEILGETRDAVLDRYPESQIDFLFRYSTYANLAAIAEHKVDITLYPRVRGVSETGCSDDWDFPSNIKVLQFSTESMLFWRRKHNTLVDKDFAEAKDCSGQTLFLGNTDNMISSGTRIVERFNQLNAPISMNCQPFSSYSDYILSTPCDGFGIVIEALHPLLRSWSDYKVFALKDLSLVVDMLILYDPSNLDNMGNVFMNELENLIAKKQCE